MSALRIVLSVLLALTTTVAVAQTDNDLADLKTLFEKDPAAGDLEGMMKVMRLVIKPAENCGYGAVLEDMIDASLGGAQPAGNWAAVAELRVARRWLSRSNYCWINSDSYPTPLALRQLTQWEAAVEAYRRAGLPVPESLARAGRDDVATKQGVAQA